MGRKLIGTYPPPPPSLPECLRAALDLYRVSPPVFRKLPDRGIATRVNISPLESLRRALLELPPNESATDKKPPPKSSES